MQRSATDQRIAAISQALADLRWAVDQDRPAQIAHHALADRYAQAIDDLDETVRTLDAQLRVATHDNGRRAALALAGAQRACARLIRLALERALGFEQFAALDELAREHPAWSGWVAGVLDSLEPLWVSLADPLDLLAELLERQPAPGSTLIVTTRPIGAEQPEAASKPTPAVAQ
jgi:hypothetical protein